MSSLLLVNPLFGEAVAHLSTERAERFCTNVAETHAVIETLQTPQGARYGARPHQSPRVRRFRKVWARTRERQRARTGAARIIHFDGD